jgi:hypothetical protein
LVVALLAPDGETPSLEPNPRSPGTQFKFDLRINGPHYVLMRQIQLPPVIE